MMLMQKEARRKKLQRDRSMKWRRREKPIRKAESRKWFREAA